MGTSSRRVEVVSVVGRPLKTVLFAKTGHPVVNARMGFQFPLLGHASGRKKGREVIFRPLWCLEPAVVVWSSA